LCSIRRRVSEHVESSKICTRILDRGYSNAHAASMTCSQTSFSLNIGSCTTTVGNKCTVSGVTVCGSGIGARTRHRAETGSFREQRRQ
jgi:hypothetical protein